MREILRIFFVPVFVASFSLFLSVGVNGQTISNYLFVEVFDSDKSPVPNATVEVAINSVRRVVTTDEDGIAYVQALPRYYRNITTSEFKVTQAGYFPVQDLGGSDNDYDGRKARVELLKIPRNKRERRALGDEQRKREFVWAAKSADFQTVRKLLKAGISPNLNTNDLRGVPSPKNVPAVVFAAASGDAKTVATLLEAKANVQSQKPEPLRAVLIFYLQADPFARRVPRNEKEKPKILESFEKTAIALIEAGADANAKGDYAETPLIAAAKRGSVNVVKMLLKKGAAVNEKDYYGKTALVHAEDARQLGANFQQIVKLLEAAGAK